MDGTRDLDLVVFGATGFTGRKAALYLAAHAPPALRWGLAARDAQKLERVASDLGRDVPRFVVDSLDLPAVRALAERTRVLLSFVGPYTKFGDPLVEACARAGTDYVDITGETLWARTVIDRFHETARANRARIVSFCGFDSVPSDLGAWMVVDWIRRTWGVGTKDVFAGFSAKGGVSGGTIASGLATMSLPKAGAFRDPVLLNPPELRTDALRAGQQDVAGVAWDPRLGKWTTPFFMGPFNTRVVRRSAALAALAGTPYGSDFRYQEVLETRSRATAYGMAGGLWAGFQLLRNPTTRRIVTRFLPAPGSGPSDEAIRRGFYRVRLIATAEDGREALGIFGDQSDPGYGSTITLATEAALTLALTPRGDLPGGAERAGVLTPAFALGGPYLERLRAAGITATVDPRMT